MAATVSPATASGSPAMTLEWLVRVLAVGIAILSLAALLVLLSPFRAPTRRGPVPADAPAGFAPGSGPLMQAPSWYHWRVIDQLSAQHILTVRVEVRRPEDALSIARQIAEPLRDRYSEILVYFYPPGSRRGLAARRVQWTPRAGYVLVDYEALQRTPP